MGSFFSIKFQGVVGFEALIKDRIAGLDIVVRVIPSLKLNDDFLSTSVMSLTYRLLGRKLTSLFARTRGTDLV